MMRKNTPDDDVHDMDREVYVSRRQVTMTMTRRWHPTHLMNTFWKYIQNISEDIHNFPNPVVVFRSATLFGAKTT